jgi:diketogulonate reductase-like aldo/keto reductase
LSESINDTVTLSNGTKMPLLDLGTYQTPDGPVVEQAFLWALELES